MSRTFLRALGLAIVVAGFCTGFVAAQPDAVQNEIKQLEGHWRITNMIESGKAIPEGQMREWLPGGGILEIVDYTILFKSPLDGSKSTKTYRVDPTAYPKKMVVMDGDAITGSGIYKFDSGNLVICITNEAANLPTEFSAPTGSQRSLMVMERIEEGQANLPGANGQLAKRRPINIPAPPAAVPAQVAAKPVVRAQIPAAPASAQITPSPIVATGGVAGRILTDAEVRQLALGTWRINDSQGSVDITFQADGVFRTYRYVQTTVNFHSVFQPTPVSVGNWAITDGRLIASVTTSTRADKVNHSFIPAVRSISATDMILVDNLGRVTRAVKLP